MKTQFLDGTCVAVLCVILTLGLWPFYSPKNAVAWLADRNGLRFGKWSTVVSSSTFQTSGVEIGAAGSVEVWLQPRRIWDSSTILAFYTPGNPSRFSLHQSEADLKLQARTSDDSHFTNSTRLYVEDAFRTSRPVFVTITSGIHGTVVYTDGVLAKTAQNLRLPMNGFTGRLVLGDSPGQPDNWSGQVQGLALYRRELTPWQVLRHYETWRHGKQSEISEDEDNIALYLFNERAGEVVHNLAKSGVDLYIPEKYLVSDKIFLEPFWREFSLSWSYWSSALKNIVGFVPFGFCFFACLSAHKVKRTALVTVILGCLVSLTIEVLQAYLPTRDSGTTDLFTNTLGTYIGVIACRAASPILAARFPWLPFVISPH
jgi:hypothetical protein